MSENRDEFLIRFLSKTKIVNNCWIWTAGKRRKGYGTFSVNGKIQGAHRVSYELFNGPITPGLFVLHKCDIPACVNPTHLFLGNNTDNYLDMKAKNRQRYAPASGEASGTSKLTYEQVDQIRQKYVPRIYTQQRLANEYGVHQAVISRVLARKIWNPKD